MASSSRLALRRLCSLAQASSATSVRVVRSCAVRSSTLKAYSTFTSKPANSLLLAASRKTGFSEISALQVRYASTTIKVPPMAESISEGILKSWNKSMHRPYSRHAIPRLIHL
ncbi:hypothetical protein BGX38DRAFT_1187349 [Terfezia claveryi]|nr:hypothetical protein BGX38DRAFT_1187349 [Terfezia claveryi]